MPFYSILRRGLFLRRKSLELASGAFDPNDWQALALGGDSPNVVYIPIPKAANSSIRQAFRPCFGLEHAKVDNIHQDNRIDKRDLSAALAAASPDAFVFSVVRHPALRARSCFQNKLGWFDHRGKLKGRFGHAARLGMRRGISFEQYLHILAATPEWAMDSHFKPQAALLQYALDDPRLQLFKTETINDEWPAIAARISELVPVGPTPTLGEFNRTKPSIKPFSDREKRLIDQIYADDFEKFGYTWTELQENS